MQSLYINAILLVYRLLCLHDEFRQKSCKQNDKHSIFVHFELCHEASILFLLVHILKFFLVTRLADVQFSLVVVHVRV